MAHRSLCLSGVSVGVCARACVSVASCLSLCACAQAVTELEELASSGVLDSPSWAEALKNLVFFFVATGQQGAKSADGGGGGGGGGGKLWVQGLVEKVLRELEHRRFNSRNAQQLKFVP
eukprot:COSAG05_NODE_329_length_11294_cov_59.570076_2_plen_119_part_00